MDRLSEFDPIAYITNRDWSESRLGLERIMELLDRLDRPQDSLRFVHVAGTNGKGSTGTYIGCTLMQAGYRVGFLSSPSILQFADQVRVNEEIIPLDALREVTLQVKAAADRMADHPTEFELMTAVAFLYFAQENCDIVVAEVGMGGRLDSTNVIERPEVAVITALGLDHQEFLGDTLEEIAGEKTGIIKPGSPVVSWPQKPEAMDVVAKRAKEAGSKPAVPDFTQLRSEPLKVVDAKLCRTFSYRDYADLHTRMAGAYQPYNAAVAIEALEVLKAAGWTVPASALRAGIAQAFVPGRFEVLDNDPLFVVDGAHNDGGVAMLVQSLAEISPNKKVVFITGVLEDKTYKSMIKSLLPLAKAFVTITPPTPRALSAETLAETIKELAAQEGKSVTAEPAKTPTEAIAQARQQAQPGEIICACGSLYSIATIKSGFLSP